MPMQHKTASLIELILSSKNMGRNY